MSFIKKIFSGNKPKTAEKPLHIHWIPLTSLNQLKEIKEQSKQEPVAIFKHSTRCGISSMVIKQFEKFFDESMKDFKVYYLDLLAFRDISDEVGYTFQVMHQSPQLLVIKDGITVAYASHYDILELNLKSF